MLKEWMKWPQGSPSRSFSKKVYKKMASIIQRILDWHIVFSHHNHLSQWYLSHLKAISLPLHPQLKQNKVRHLDISIISSPRLWNWLEGASPILALLQSDKTWAKSCPTPALLPLHPCSLYWLEHTLSAISVSYSYLLLNLMGGSQREKYCENFARIYEDFVKQPKCYTFDLYPLRKYSFCNFC